MNNRIRELYETAIVAAGRENQFTTTNMNVAEKFAELIIDECLNQCYNRGMNDELYEGQLRAAEYIEQHFGVEE